MGAGFVLDSHGDIVTAALPGRCRRDRGGPAPFAEGMGTSVIPAGPSGTGAGGGGASTENEFFAVLHVDVFASR
jgi:hypothetical protein